MSHVVYTTHALVLGSSQVQDADKLFWLLTEELGLVFASAKSVREETSKLRYALQDLSFVRVSLVRGRGLWRITGAEEAQAQELTMDAAKTFGRVATLVRRVTPTDEGRSELFAIVRNARDVFTNNPDKTELIESVTVARVLYRLGYLSCTEQFKGIVDTTEFDEQTFARAERVAQQLVHDINAGLAESQL